MGTPKRKKVTNSIPPVPEDSEQAADRAPAGSGAAKYQETKFSDDLDGIFIPDRLKPHNSLTVLLYVGYSVQAGDRHRMVELLRRRWRFGAAEADQFVTLAGQFVLDSMQAAEAALASFGGSRPQQGRRRRSDSGPTGLCEERGAGL